MLPGINFFVFPELPVYAVSEILLHCILVTVKMYILPIRLIENSLKWEESLFK